MPSYRLANAMPKSAGGGSKASSATRRCVGKTKPEREAATGRRRAASVASKSSSKAPASGEASYDKSAEGHGLCVVCQASSRSTPWAATRGVGLGDEVTPLGNICKACYEVFEIQKNRDMKDIDAFVHKALSSKAFRASVEKCKLVKTGQASTKDFSAEACYDLLESNFRVVQPFVVLSQRELLKELNRSNPTLSRVPKYLTDSLTKVDLPPNGDATRMEPHYMFRHPSRPFKELEVVSLFGVRRERALLTNADSAYSGHGDTVMQDKVKSVLDISSASAAADKARSLTMTTLDDYMSNISTKMAKARKPTKPRGSSDPADSDESMDPSDDSEDESADENDDSSAVGGPAADLYASSEAARSAKKQLPPVPPFTPPTKRSRLASEAGGSATSAGSPCDAAAGDEDEADDDDRSAIVRLPGPLCFMTPSLCCPGAVWQRVGTVGLGSS